jgi:Aspartyl protease
MEQSENFIITVTLATTGETELLDASNVGTIHELSEWSSMLFGAPSNIRLFKDGALLDTSHTLEQAGVTNGDLILVVAQTVQSMARPQTSQPSQTLDFSTLLNQADSARSPTPTSTRGLNFSTLLSGELQQEPPRPFVYPDGSISLDDAIQYNPHPRAFAELLLSNESLFKEFNYHHPILAEKMRNTSVDEAADIWRDAVTKGSIQAAVAHTERRQKEQTMRTRLVANPNDEEAKLFFEQIKNQTLIQEQYRDVMENYPESMGKILMLYIDTHVNGVAVQSFVDSGRLLLVLRVAHCCTVVVVLF